jgi:hypothetical protein
MRRQRLRFYGTLAACFLGFGALGGPGGLGTERSSRDGAGGPGSHDSTRPPGVGGVAMTAAHRDRTGSPHWPAMPRLHTGGRNRCYLRADCGAVREDVFRGGAIAEGRWHHVPDGLLLNAVGEKAPKVLKARKSEQLRICGL